MIGRFFGRGRKGEDDDKAPSTPAVSLDPAVTYEDDKQLARSADPKVRLQLAKRENVKPELLYYLAADQTNEVRRAIATNVSTPAQANLLLTRDDDDDTRAEIAKKIGRLLPDMPADESDRVREVTLQVIEILARDQLPRIRAIVAEEIKTATNVPKHIVMDLAQDVSAIVSAPILEYSPLLSDDDLLEIIATGAVADRLSAIARRPGLGGDVADAVVATLDGPAVAALLANPSAQIREATLDTIVDHAASMENWHKPLVMRAELSMRAMRRISGFVASSLIEKLAERHDLNPAFRDELRDSVRERLGSPPAAPDDQGPDRARKLFQAGKLDDEAIVAGIEKNDRDFVLAALSLKSGLPLPTVAKVVQSRQPKSVTAVVWKAKLSMRTAMRVQLKVALIPAQQILNAKHGVDYPLPDSEFEAQLKLF